MAASVTPVTKGKSSIVHGKEPLEADARPHQEMVRGELTVSNVVEAMLNL